MSLQLITTRLHGFQDWHANSIMDFEEFLGKIPKDGLTIYRGQNSDRPLLPYVSRRKPKQGTFLEMERKIFHLFKNEAKKWLEAWPTNDWDWLSLAQHYKLATRLLDWTRDPFIGLWFALRNTPRRRKFVPEVWVLTPDKQDVIDTKETSSPFKGTRTKVFLPDKQFPRIQVQKGAFVVFKYMSDFPKKFVALEKNRLMRSKLRRVRFPAYHRKNLLQLLEQKGINERAMFPNPDRLEQKGINECAMFPDLDGLGKEIITKYTRDRIA
jgi:hypothetical protein